MKVAIRFRTALPAPTRSYLRPGGFLLSALGIVALGYCGFVLLDSVVYQAYHARRFQQTTARSAGSGGHVRPQTLPPPAEPGGVLPRSLAAAGRLGSPLGRIEIPALGVAAMILEGIDDKTLRRAVGHFPGTSLPGQPGNVAIAGHRDTFFRALRAIREGDEITLTTLEGSYRYRVDSTRVVAPGAIEVLDESAESILTLVTCYPFAFVGPAPMRFVVRARWITG